MFNLNARVMISFSATFLTVLFISCKETSTKVVPPKPTQGSGNTIAQKPGVVETPEPPSSIAGALLDCQNEIDGSTETPQILLGCRFMDEDSSRKDIQTIANRVEFAYVDPGQNEINIQVKPISGDKNYDVLFLLIGNDLSIVKEASESIKILGFLKKASGSGKDSVIAATVNIHKTKVPQSLPGQAPGPRPVNIYDDFVTQMLIDFKNGKVTPPLPLPE